jgi:hypothetical protein
MRLAYETFLKLYPAPWRELFGCEMASVFEQATNDQRSRGIVAYFRFLCVEFAGLVSGAFSAWSGDLTGRTGQRRWLTASSATAVIAGVALTLVFQNFFYTALPKHLGNYRPAPGQDSPFPLEITGLVILIASCLIFISLFSAAFVLNMRIIGNRAGRLKPIWMPGRANNARVAGRDQKIHRHPGRQRRELHRRGR